MLRRIPSSASHSTTVLWADVAFECAVAVLALIIATTGADALGFSRIWLFGIAAAFAAAAIAIVPIARQPRTAIVAALAWGNMLGGVVLWCVLTFYWATWTPEARWLVAGIADGFVVLGVLELVLVRRGSFR